MSGLAKNVGENGALATAHVSPGAPPPPEVLEQVAEQIAEENQVEELDSREQNRGRQSDEPCREAAFAGDLSSKDWKKYLSLNPQQQMLVRYYLSLLVNSQRAGQKGWAVTELEKIMGRELDLYGGPLTDSFSDRPDEIRLKALYDVIREHWRVYSTRAAQAAKNPKTCIYSEIRDTTKQR